MKWFAAEIQGGGKSTQANAHQFDDLIEKVKNIDTKLIVLPHFVGTGTPWMDTRSKGAILGLSLKTRREDIFKAVLEGITFEMRLNLDCLEKAGISVNELVVTGGGAKSKTLIEMKSDILCRPIKRISTSEAGSLGCSILAATAMGEYASLNEAMSYSISEIDVTKPNKIKNDSYKDKYSIYKKLYPVLSAINNLIDELH